MLSYTLCAVAIGFLLGQAGLKDNAVNAVANIFGMVLSRAVVPDLLTGAAAAKAYSLLMALAAIRRGLAPGRVS